MKKLMIAAAVAVLGIAANAASIEWGSTAGNFTDDKGVVYTSATAPAGKFWLCYLGNSTDGWSYDDAVKVGEAGTLAFKDSMGTKTAKATGKYIVDTSAYKNGDVFAIMFEDDDGLKQLDAVGGEIKTYEISGLKDDSSSLDAFTFATGNYTVASVPEPTSGLLLLLGVAGMALRRRRA